MLLQVVEQPELEVRARVVVIELDGLVEHALALLELALVAQLHTEVDVHHRVVGRALDGSAELERGLVDLAELVEGESELELELAVVGGELGRLTERIDSLLVAIQDHERSTLEREPVGVVGVRGEHLLGDLERRIAALARDQRLGVQLVATRRREVGIVEGLRDLSRALALGDAKQVVDVLLERVELLRLLERPGIVLVRRLEVVVVDRLARLLQVRPGRLLLLVVDLLDDFLGTAASDNGEPAGYQRGQRDRLETSHLRNIAVRRR